MKILIEGVGIVKKSTIECNGLTVITGKNGSGKSTFAKSFVSIVSGLVNANDSFFLDLKSYVINSLREPVDDVLHLFRYSNSHINGGEFAFLRPMSSFVDYPSCISLYKNNIKAKNIDELHCFVRDLSIELYKIRDTIFKDHDALNNYRRRIKSRDINDLFTDLFALIDDIENKITLHDLRKYEHSLINSQLNHAFSGQFVSKDDYPDQKGVVSIEDNGFYIRYNHNNYDDFKVNDLYFDKKAFYILDGNVIDKIDGTYTTKTKDNKDNDVSPSFYSLDNQLLIALKASNRIVSLDNKEKYKDIIKILNEVIPFDIQKIEGKTVNASNGVNIKNEASGAKIFIIIKQLLLNGKIDKDTTLVLDEPENHLHPEWQVKLVTILLNMTKIIGCKIFLITHSSTLLLATDVYTKKLDCKDKYRVYFGEKNDNLVANFVDYTDNLGEAHKQLNDPYIFMGFDVIK